MGVQGVRETLMIAGGGTVGHIYPAIAIAQEWQARDRQRRVVFVGTEHGLEKSIVPRAGFPLAFISVGGLKGKRGVDLLRNLARLPLGFVQAWKLITRNRPRVALGVGGYSTRPVLVTAWLPPPATIIHEAHAVPLLTPRIIRRVVTAVGGSFD